MDTKDLTIICADCSQEFTFTAGEQAWFAQRGLNQPRRCKPCRDFRRQEREAREVAS